MKRNNRNKKVETDASTSDDTTMVEKPKTSTRKRGRKDKTDQSKESVNTTSSLLLTAASDPVGLIKRDFLFNRKSANMVPPLIIQEMYPLSGLYAWVLEPPTSDNLGKNTDDIKSPVTYTKFDSDTSPVFPKIDGEDPVLFAANSMTQDFTNLVWPSYSALFESGLRDDVDITQSTFIRIILSTHAIYSFLQSVNTLIDLWKQSTDNPSNELSRLIIKLAANDSYSVVRAKVRSQIESLSVKIGHLPVMPEMVLETRRMLTPFIDPGMPETLIFTMHSAVASASVSLDVLMTRAHAMLDNLFANYHDEIATLKTFIPTTVLSESAVTPGSISVDPIRAVGRYNSNMFSNTLLLGTDQVNDESDGREIMGYEVSLEGEYLRNDDFTNPGKVIANYSSFCHNPSTIQTSTDLPFNENRYFQTIGEAISFIEVLSTTVYYLQYDDGILLANNVGYVQVTPHTWGSVYIPDDTDKVNAGLEEVQAAFPNSTLKGANKKYSEALFRRVGIALCRNSSNQAWTRYPQYRRGVLDPNNLRASLIKIAPYLFNLPGLQILDVSQAGKFISPTAPGVRDAYKSKV